MKIRQNPERLGEKLKRIRLALHLSQEQMIKRLGFEDELIQAHISAYERKKNSRVPPPGVILQYAKLANVYVDFLIDDELELPDHLPARNKTLSPDSIED